MIILLSKPALTAMRMVVEGPEPPRTVDSTATEKFDSWLSEEMLCDQYVSAHIDCVGVIRAAKCLHEASATTREPPIH